MKDYRCKLCGYVYSESSENEFNNLPDNWVCPICGAVKDEFEEI